MKCPKCQTVFTGTIVDGRVTCPGCGKSLLVKKKPKEPVTSTPVYTEPVTEKESVHNYEPDENAYTYDKVIPENRHEYVPQPIQPQVNNTTYSTNDYLHLKDYMLFYLLTLIPIFGLLLPFLILFRVLFKNKPAFREFAKFQLIVFAISFVFGFVGTLVVVKSLTGLVQNSMNTFTDVPTIYESELEDYNVDDFNIEDYNIYIEDE